MVSYTITAILDSVRRRGMIPKSSDRSFNQDQLIAIAAEELQTYIVSVLKGVREEHFASFWDVPVVAGQLEYPLPARAIGGTLRKLLCGSGTGTSFRLTGPVPRLEPEQAYTNWQGGSFPTSSFGYTFRGPYIALTAPSSSGTLRMVYFRRPNQLVAESACAQITAVNANTGVVTTGPVPSTLTSSLQYDFVQAQPGFDLTAMDQTPTAFTSDPASGTFTFASLPSTLAVGDWVCLSGQSPIPQIPVELHPLLAQRVVVKVLEGLGDPKVATAETLCEKQKADALVLLTPRSDGDPRYIVNRNGPGWGNRFGGVF